VSIVAFRCRDRSEELVRRIYAAALIVTNDRA
jgi:hypothetical protein